ncbi:MAG: B12-binding domain-containing radical SAM protein [Planctomycetes bacterium]|nr:B12-binding domain-containing radical SAM protein [Planctomycetota bacterium]
MRVLIASAPHRDTFGYSMPPPGLLRLGGWLEREGVGVDLLDLAHELAAGRLPAGDGLCDAAADAILSRGPFDAVGLSVMGATLPAGLAILERIRARERALPLWLGGPGTTGVDAALVTRTGCVDAVVRGEGEVTTTELIQATAAGSSPRGVAGVTWRAADGRAVREPDRAPIADLVRLAPCAWHLLPSIAEYKRITGAADGLVPIDSGRGCVYDCSFCTIGRFWSRRSRVLPPERLAYEVCALRGIEGARAAYLCHDLFGANRAHAVAFCRELLQRGTPVPWEVRARADHLDRELLALMGHAGCYRVLLGIESAAATVRERCDKQLDPRLDLLALVRDCVECGVTPILSVILGLPGEGPAEREASLDFCARAALLGGVNVSLHLVNPQPGCGLGQEFGGEARAVEGIPPDMARGAGETAPERGWIARHPELFTTFALLPGDEAEQRALAQIAEALPEVLQRYPRTFALLRRVLGLSAGELFEVWQREGRSFEACARARRDPLVDDLLAVEQAAVRAGALAGAAPARGPRALGVRVAVRCDLPRVLEALRAGAEPPRGARPGWIAVVPARAGRPLAGTRTLAISPEAAQLLAALDGARTLEELESRHPGIGAAIGRLAHAGLIEHGTEDRPAPALEEAAS